MLFPWFRQDIPRVGYVGKRKWFQWGYRETGNLDGTKDWYILLMLPSYSWRPVIWNDTYGMHQAGLLYKAPIPTGAGKWEVIDLPI